MGAGGLAGGAERQSYKVVAPGWQERAVEKHLREAIIHHTANVHGAGSRRDPPCPCPAMLVIEGPTRRYGAKASRRRCVPRDRRRRLHRRDRSINRLETPTAGCIRFGGIDVASLSGGEPARALRDDIPAVQSGWQARRADPRPDRPPQPHADVARGTPALVGRGQGVHVFRARAVRHRQPRRATRDNRSRTNSPRGREHDTCFSSRPFPIVDSLVTYRGSIRLFGRAA